MSVSFINLCSLDLRVGHKYFCFKKTCKYIAACLVFKHKILCYYLEGEKEKRELPN